MKTSIKIILISLLMIAFATAQAQKIYFNVGAGYGFGIGTSEGMPTYNYTYVSTQSSSYSNPSQTGSQTNTYEKSVFHPSEGLKITGDIGYHLSSNISVELGFNYLTGTNQTNTYTSSSTNNYTDDNTFNPGFNTYSDNTWDKETFKMTTKGRLLLLPALCLQTNPSEITPYIKAGLVVDFGGTFIFNDEFDYGGSTVYPNNPGSNNSSSSQNTREIQSTGGMSLGLMSSMGANYKFSENFFLFAEVGMVIDNWSPAHGEYTKYVRDGVDAMSRLSTKTFDYSSKFTNTVTYPNTTSPNTITIQKTSLAPIISYSSWSINVGIKYYIK
ncbi:MAG: hypothetical protein WCL14_09125 [Bacteroidota bacterium]